MKNVLFFINLDQTTIIFFQTLLTSQLIKNMEFYSICSMNEVDAEKNPILPKNIPSYKIFIGFYFCLKTFIKLHK